MKRSMLAVPVALLLAGCVTDQATEPAPKPLVGYVPSLQQGKSLDELRTEVETILADLHKWLIRRNYMGHSRLAYFAGSTKVRVGEDGVSMTFQEVGRYDYDRPIPPGAHSYAFSYDELAAVTYDATTCTTTTAPLPHGMELWYSGTTIGPEVCDTLFALGRRYRQERKAEIAAFAEQAARYRAMAVKPALSEDLRRRIVQAETLRERKDYAGAVDLFRQALRHDPIAYPAGYFNLALLYEQQENYVSAAEAMKKYLLLQPNAPDSRSAQDKIYSWEMLARRP